MAHSQSAARIRQPAEPLDCGIPLDSQYFDEARFENIPSVGGVLALARVELPAQYCGVLEYFSQYTDAWANDNALVETPHLVWQILVNRQPLSPYHQMRTILNPWGFGSFQFSLRLPESAVVEMVVRRLGDAPGINRLGGRLLGRYWYNSAYGGAR